MGIYSYELYKFYDVANIIRIGSCGSNDKNIKLLDVILSTSSYNEGEFAYNFNNKHVHEVEPSVYLNNIIDATATLKNINIIKGKTACCEVFDAYMEDYRIFLNRCPNNIIASEMEAFALFYIAKSLNKNAACLLTVSDSKYDKKVVSATDREKSLTTMIELALDSTLKVSD
jgi:purine-nucleoside phosphorylase